VGYFVLKLHTHTHTLWAHQRFILHLVKNGILPRFRLMPKKYDCLLTYCQLDT